MSTPVAVVDEIVGRGGDADDVLRAVVSALAAQPGVAWAGIAFVEDAALRLGPVSGDAVESSRQRAPISYQDAVVGELWLDGDVPADERERIAELIAPLVLIGWDTGGEAWEP